MKDDQKTKKQLVAELTELRSQNAALNKSESPEKYRNLVENLRDVIYELDSQGVVLYISPTIRDLLSPKLNLKKTGNFEVLPVTSGATGIILASEEQPDLTLIDIIMPELDGGQVANNYWRF